MDRRQRIIRNSKIANNILKRRCAKCNDEIDKIDEKFCDRCLRLTKNLLLSKKPIILPSQIDVSETPQIIPEPLELNVQSEIPKFNKSRHIIRKSY